MFESSLVNVFVFRIIPILILVLFAAILNFTSNVFTRDLKEEAVEKPQHISDEANPALS